MSPSRTYCASPRCRARIFKAQTVSGSTVPLDAGPIDFERASELGWSHVYAYIPDTNLVAPAGPLLGLEDLYASHFRTCAAPMEFTGKQGRSGRS